MDTTTNPEFDHHEEFHQFNDPRTGLSAFVAIHSTALGPSAGEIGNIPNTLREVLKAARLENQPPHICADAMAGQTIADAVRNGRFAETGA